jgi:hypothetical protein
MRPHSYVGSRYRQRAQHARVVRRRYLCDIQFELSASYAASRWCVTRSTKDADAMYVAEGKFVFGTSWDETVVHTIIADIFAQVYPGATVKIEWPSVLAVPPPAPWWKRVLAWLDKG